MTDLQIALMIAAGYNFTIFAFLVVGGGPVLAPLTTFILAIPPAIATAALLQVVTFAVPRMNENDMTCLGLQMFVVCHMVMLAVIFRKQITECARRLLSHVKPEA